MEEPLVLARGVSVLKELLDGLFGVCALTRLLEGLRRDGALQTLKLECVPGWEEVRVVDGLRN